MKQYKAGETLPHITLPACVTKPSSLMFTCENETHLLWLDRSNCTVIQHTVKVFGSSMTKMTINMRYVNSIHTLNSWFNDSFKLNVSDAMHIVSTPQLGAETKTLSTYQRTWKAHDSSILLTSMIVPFVMTPKDVYNWDVGFFVTPMMGRKNVACSCGCVTFAFLKRRACNSSFTPT